jgi:uncharacterized protein (DUF2147 family)
LSRTPTAAPRSAAALFLAALALGALGGRTLAAAADEDGAGAILGLWETADGKAHVAIGRDGEGFHGDIVWLGQPLYPADDPGGMAGRPRVDRENPDPARRGRPIVGLRILSDLGYGGDGGWSGGAIYDPDSGKTYRCKARLGADGVLHLRGYIGISLLGRTTEWTRVPAPPAQADGQGDAD